MHTEKLKRIGKLSLHARGFVKSQRYAETLNWQNKAKIKSLGPTLMCGLKCWKSRPVLGY